MNLQLNHLINFDHTKFAISQCNKRRIVVSSFELHITHNVDLPVVTHSSKQDYPGGNTTSAFFSLLYFFQKKKSGLLYHVTNYFQSILGKI